MIGTAEPFQASALAAARPRQRFHAARRPAARSGSGRPAASPHKSRGQIGDGADRAVVPAPLESDRADRRIALRDADAEAQLVAALGPVVAPCWPMRSRIASAMRTARSAGFGIGTGSLNRIVMPSPVKCSSVPSYSRISLPGDLVILAQHAHDFLGLGDLGERGEAAQVEEHDGDFAAVALQRILGAAADDQLGQLRREEAPQAADALELARPARRRAAPARRSTP